MMTSDQQAQRRQDRMASHEEADRIMALPPEQRFLAVLQMPPDERQVFVRSLRPQERQEIMDSLTSQQREQLRAMNNPTQVVVGELMQGKLLRAVYSERELQEVMTDFWFNHFNVFAAKGLDLIWTGSFEHDAIRPHTMGNFRTLLGATARHPAMQADGGEVQPCPHTWHLLPPGATPEPAPERATPARAPRKPRAGGGKAKP